MRTGDPTLPWPSRRGDVDAGTLTINHVETEAPGNCRDINFDPLVLPAGIEPSDDPILSSPVGHVFAILHPARGREEDAERGANSPPGKGS